MADFYAGFSALPQYLLHSVITQGAQEVVNNRTIVNGALYVEKTSGSGYWTANGGNTGGLTGDLAIYGGGWAPYDFRAYSQRLIASGSAWVVHASNGTRTASGTFVASDSNGGNMGSAGGNWALGLTTIPRGAVDRWNGSSWPMQMMDRWNGSAWAMQVLERWNGSTWVKEI